MICIRNIRKSYGIKENSFPILKGISLEIKDGDFVAILGASGSGKTTLLNVVSGLEKVDEGQIFYDSLNIEELSETELTKFRKDNIGFVFQSFYLLPNMNVLKNVKLGADLINNKDYKDVIEKVGLLDKLNKFPRELSGGEQQRVAIARALSKKPKFLFLDEPTGALDEQTGREILDYLIKLQKAEKFTMIMVTHNQNIAQMANTIVMINSGQIQNVYQNETPKDAYEIAW
ncbi:ABC-type antimicrobial peptide transport system, ATPase component [Alteracholeplasma palmae J233]|uniref:ABC-type antimicrobial peptide transport system, ATPase component n=1 Tax=Alteracholeplasma palmae (strain ATCC 49389 / J233) TaxID=1318466 RepID=U4KLK5_ALTPJ|nr:ABC transporter ATP-binding protein [Alteracholeplasma palmae]CCV64747.1 ABC-type antimicrobial peptide transport system, ATPase component [Alteracholeplasma palmae J233]